MSGQLWEVVGGKTSNGIVVREGQGTKSKEVSERLSCGAFIKEIALVGDRLNYERLTGSGPKTGWVSLKFKTTDLVVKTDKEPPNPPLMACFYSGGMTAQQGRCQLAAWLKYAKTEIGLKDVVVLDHVGEPGYEDCKDWDDYTSKLLAKIDEKCDDKDRPVFIVAHSHGCVPAWGLARKLGERCLQLCVLCRRPPNGHLLDETWGVDKASDVAKIKDGVLLRQMVLSWPNQVLEPFVDKDPIPDQIKQALAVVKRQYSSPCYPCGSADVESIVGDGQKITAPILAIAASDETKRGETKEKMEGWSSFTSGQFDLQVALGDHMGLMARSSEAFPLLKAIAEPLMP